MRVKIVWSEEGNEPESAPGPSRQDKGKRREVRIDVPTPPSPVLGILGESVTTYRHLLFERHVREQSRGGSQHYCRAPCFGDHSNHATAQIRIHHLQTVYIYSSVRTPQQIFFWCQFCEDFVWQVPQTHGYGPQFAQHLPDAFSTVKAYGCHGVRISHRPIVPASCIFCLHDATKPAIVTNGGH